MPARTVVLLTADRVGPAMAGPAIRTVEFARVLATDGHHVTIAAPWIDGTATDLGLEAGAPETPGTIELVAAWGTDLHPVVAAADVVVAMTGVLHELSWIEGLRHHGVKVVADAYDPVLFEVLVGFADTPEPRRTELAAGATASMCEPLRWADMVLCASASQRHLLLGVLAAQGRLGPAAYDADPGLRTAVAEVPFGLPPDPPDTGGLHPLRGPDGPFGPDDTIVVWGGGLWDWLDPLTLIEAAARLGDTRLKVFFMAGAHPTPSVPTMAMVDRARQLAVALDLCDPDGSPGGRTGPAVAFADAWIGYRQRAAYLCDADIGATLAPDHVETTFAYRTRMLDYLWTSLPVLCSAGDDLATLVEAQGLGVVVPSGDVGACAAALQRLADPDWYALCRSQVAHAASAMTWPAVTGPLREFCLEPHTTLSEPIPLPTAAVPAAVAASAPVAGATRLRSRLASLAPGLAAGYRRRRQQWDARAARTQGRP